MNKWLGMAMLSAVVCIGAGARSNAPQPAMRVAADSVSVEIENSMGHQWQILYETSAGRVPIGMIEDHATTTFTAPAPLDTLRFWASAPLVGMEDQSILVIKKEPKKHWNLL